MLFPTATFAIFFMIVLPLSWALMRSPAIWRPFIIAADYRPTSFAVAPPARAAQLGLF